MCYDIDEIKGKGGNTMEDFMAKLKEIIEKVVAFFKDLLEKFTKKEAE